MTTDPAEKPRAARTFSRLNASEAFALLNSRPRIFDARDELAFAAGHIDGATLLNSASLNAALFATSKNDTVLIYCYHGNASETYGEMFAEFGFTQVFDLIDGYDAWQRYQAIRAADERGATLSPGLREWLAAEGFKDIDHTIANASTPLMQATRLGATSIVRELLDLGTPTNQLNALNLDGNTALWLACFNGNPEIVDMLLAAGIAIDHQNHNGASCLMYAASAGKTDIVKRLIAANADISLASLDDFTALDMAANIECLRLLRNYAPPKSRSVVKAF